MSTSSNDSIGQQLCPVFKEVHTTICQRGRPIALVPADTKPDVSYKAHQKMVAVTHVDGTREIGFIFGNTVGTFAKLNGTGEVHPTGTKPIESVAHDLDIFKSRLAL